MTDQQIGRFLTPAHKAKLPGVAAIALALFAFAGTASAQDARLVDVLPVPVLQEWNADAARSVIAYDMAVCADTPVPQLSFDQQRRCESLDRIRADLQSKGFVGALDKMLTDDQLCTVFGQGTNCRAVRAQRNIDAAAARGGFHDPASIDLCPAPRKLTRDGCQ